LVPGRSLGANYGSPVTLAAPERATSPFTLRLVVAVAVGLAVGAGTSAAQTFLGGSALSGLANAVSPWTMASFFVGAAGHGRRTAAALGVAAAVAQVAGYYLTAGLRGFGVDLLNVSVWAVAALIAGVVFGIAGHSWARGTGRERGLGAALVVAVWACEAVVSYGIVLGYVDDAVAFSVIAIVLFVLLGRRGGRHAAVLGWLVPALVSGVAGMLFLHAVL
jgi:hypothetical protein